MDSRARGMEKGREERKMRVGVGGGEERDDENQISNRKTNSTNETATNS